MKGLYESILDADIIDKTNKIAATNLERYEDMMKILKPVSDVFKEYGYECKVQAWGRPEDRYGQPNGNAYGISGVRVYTFKQEKANKSGIFDALSKRFKDAYQSDEFKTQDVSITGNSGHTTILFKKLKVSVNVVVQRTVGSYIKLCCRQDDKQMCTILNAYGRGWEEAF